MALGHGALLPALPFLPQHWPSGADAGNAPGYTDALAAAIRLRFLFFLPVWASFIYRLGPRAVTLIGVGGFVVVLVAILNYEQTPSVYGSRLLAGAFGFAVLAATAALIREIIAPGQAPALVRLWPVRRCSADSCSVPQSAV